nr:MAG TPA: hypothetical protein [Bacteriophage sp.]
MLFHQIHSANINRIFINSYLYVIFFSVKLYIITKIFYNLQEYLSNLLI